MKPLTPREYQVVALLREGLSYPKAAAQLHVTVGTFRQYVNRIRDKLPPSDLPARKCVERAFARAA